MNTDKLANSIEEAIRKAAKVSSNNTHHNATPVIPTTNDISYSDAIKNDRKVEFDKWKSILYDNDPKSIWMKIDFNGK